MSQTWTKCSEGMPVPGKEPVIICNNGVVLKTLFYRLVQDCEPFDSFQPFDDYSFSPVEDLENTLWQPLPLPPR